MERHLRPAIDALVEALARIRCVVATLLESRSASEGNPAVLGVGRAPIERNALHPVLLLSKLGITGINSVKTHAERLVVICQRAVEENVPAGMAGDRRAKCPKAPWGGPIRDEHELKRGWQAERLGGAPNPPVVACRDP